MPPYRLPSQVCLTSGSAAPALLADCTHVLVIAKIFCVVCLHAADEHRGTGGSASDLCAVYRNMSGVSCQSSPELQSLL